MDITNGPQLAPNDVVIKAFMEGALAALKQMPEYECVFLTQRDMLRTVSDVAEEIRSDRKQLEYMQRAIPADESAVWLRTVGTFKDSWLLGFGRVITEALTHESAYVSTDACIHMVRQMSKYADEHCENVLRHLTIS